MNSSSIYYLTYQYRKHSHIQRNSLGRSDDSLSDHTPTPTGSPSKLSALEFSVFWKDGERSVKIHLSRVILKSWRIIKTRELLLKTQFIHLPKDLPKEEIASKANMKNIAHEVHTRILKTSREQILQEEVIVAVSEEVSSYMLCFEICERRHLVCGEVLWQGMFPISNLEANIDNSMCVILRPQPIVSKHFNMTQLYGYDRMTMV